MQFVYKSLRFYFILLGFVTSFTVFASETQPHDNSSEGEIAEIEAYKHHHLLDSYDFTFFSDEKNDHHYGFSLPIILWDSGLKIFSSSKFQHEKAVASVDGANYKIVHGKIYKTDAAGTIKFNKEGHVENDKPLDFSITKNVFTILISAILLILIFTSMAKSYKKGPLPTGLGRFLEPMVLYVQKEVIEDNINPKKSAKFVPLLLTIFFFILILNLLGITPVGVNVTGNITTTLFLSLLIYLVVQFSANLDYWKHIFWMPDVPVLMKLVLIPIELLGTLTKPFALMMRLFANITAGHIVMMSLIGLIYIMKNVFAYIGFPILTLGISFIELFVAFLQAYVFTMLAALFIGQAVEEHDHH